MGNTGHPSSKQLSIEEKLRKAGARIKFQKKTGYR
jgi:hypothetical protein